MNEINSEKRERRVLENVKEEGQIEGVIPHIIKYASDRARDEHTDRKKRDHRHKIFADPLRQNEAKGTQKEGKRAHVSRRQSVFKVPIVESDRPQNTQRAIYVRQKNERHKHKNDPFRPR